MYVHMSMYCIGDVEVSRLDKYFCMCNYILYICVCICICVSIQLHIYVYIY